MSAQENNLFSKVLKYKKISQEIQKVLSRHPYKYQEYQGIFNKTLEDISYDIFKIEERIDFDENKFYRLKRLFQQRYRRYFLYGFFINWVYEKPFGYAGDFKIIDYIYSNNPDTKGFDRLWDDFSLQLKASKATRDRKEDFKHLICDYVKKNKGRDLLIMNLASGPAREIVELLEHDKKEYFKNVKFDCFDYCKEALSYADNLLKNRKNVNFEQKNAIRLALKKNVEKELPNKYDLIYSTGLFDYLDERVAIRLVKNLKKRLKEKGVMVISNYRDKHHNPSAYLMEWLGEWNLIYRSQDDFKKIFVEGGFNSKDLNFIIQEIGVMQYCIASNSHED